MKILSAAEMQACDRLTSEKFSIPSAQLMHNAARAVATFAMQQFPVANRITVLCGRGNNGGDGMVAANLLASAGRQVTVILLGDPATLKGDAQEAWNAFTSAKPPTDQNDLQDGPLRTTIIITEARQLAQHHNLLQADLILDAILGTGFKPPMRDLPLAALNWFKSNAGSAPVRAPILAIDLPTGWDADSLAAAPTAEAFPADSVITFTAPKPAHVFGQLTRNYAQPIVVAPIGSPDEAIVSTLSLHWSGSSKTIAESPRPTESNKGMYGHVLVIGGSQGKSGAPGMASLAALRCGAGLVTAAVAPSVLPLVASLAPELMTHPLETDNSGQISPTNLDPEKLKTLLHKITVVAIGPGLGTSPETAQFALTLLEQTARSGLTAVVDADALNILSAHPDRLAAIAKDRTLVLTPHPGEMSRLTGLSIPQIESDRLAIARDYATRNQLILVLKGSRTLIAHPDGSVAVNTTGNPGMAKGGSGDLLTGIVAGLLAQFPNDPRRAVEAAVYLHGLAADITVQSPGIGGDQHTLLATDSLHNLSRAFRYRAHSDSGYCWLQGRPRNSPSPGNWRNRISR